jgi:hypothetical protein
VGREEIQRPMTWYDLGIHPRVAQSESRLVLIALPGRVESRSFPDDFRRVTATLLPESL